MLQECTESILVPEWNFPVYVKSSKDSEALQEFVKIPFGSLLKQDFENSLDEIIKKCQHHRFHRSASSPSPTASVVQSVVTSIVVLGP